MNLFPVNGGALNGGVRLVTVAAAASFSCVAGFSATPTRVQDALAPYLGSTQFIAAGTHQHGGVAALTGTVSLRAAPHTNKAAAAHVVGSGGFSAYVLRGLSGEAFFIGQSQLQAIPASVLGYSQPISVTASVYANATKEQPGIAGIGAAGSVAVTANPQINRYVEAHLILGSADFYAETNINGIDEAYSNLVGTAHIDIIEVGLVTKLGASNVIGTSTVVPEGTHSKTAVAVINSSGFLMGAEAHIALGGISDLGASCSISAAGTSISSGNADFSNLVDFEAAASIEHGSAAANIQCGSEVIPALLFTSMAIGHFGAKVDMQAQAIVVRMLESKLVAQAQFNASGFRGVVGVPAAISGFAEFSIYPDTTIRQGNAEVISAPAEVLCEPTRFVQGGAEIAGFVDVVAAGGRYLTSSAQFDGAVTLIPDSFRNPFAKDPADRTFYRSPVSGFVSPKRNTEFRRPA